MVMHPKSWYLIPEPYRGLMPKRFMDISPYKFKIDKEGMLTTDKEDEVGIPLIPFVDPERMILETRDYPIPDMYKEEPNIFILTIQNALPPRIPTSLREAQKMYERQLQANEEIRSKSKSLPSKTKEAKMNLYKTSEEIDEDLEASDEEIIVRGISKSHSLKSPKRYANEVKEEIEKEEIKEQEEVIVAEVIKRAKRPQWVSTPLM